MCDLFGRIEGAYNTFAVTKCLNNWENLPKSHSIYTDLLVTFKSILLGSFGDLKLPFYLNRDEKVLIKCKIKRSTE